jgi:hypothetical protein
MKKLFLILFVLAFAVVPALADEPGLPIEVGDTVAEEGAAVNLKMDSLQGSVLDKLPPLKNAALYNIREGGIEYAGLLEVVKYKGFNLDVGYSPSQSIIAGISYDGLPSLAELGVKIPVLDLVDVKPGVYVGWDRIDVKDFRDTRENFFLGASILEFRFY